MYNVYVKINISITESMCMKFTVLNKIKFTLNVFNVPA